MRSLKKTDVVIFCILLGLPLWSSAKNIQVKYEPNIVEIKGKLEIQTFPGLPNYESIASGDQAEKGFYVRLDHPIDVIGDKNDSGDNAQTELQVKVLQLATSHDDGTWDQIHKAGVGAHVTITGVLFHRLSGHNHSRVLLSVTRVK